MSEDSPAAVNMDAYTRPGGLDGGRNGTFCGAPHPGNPTDPEGADPGLFHWCRLLKGHAVRSDNPIQHHSAFTHSISEPEEWY